MDALEAQTRRAFAAFASWPAESERLDGAADATLSLCNLRPALLAVLGEELRASEVRQLVRDAIEKDPWDLRNGIDLIQFCRLSRAVCAARAAEEGIALAAYYALDGRRRGSVSAEDFAGALRAVAPRFAARHAADLFAAADGCGGGQISRPRVMLLLHAYLSTEP